MVKRSPTVPFTAESNLILAMRETGYSSTSTAVAELVDNSIQAGANTVDIRVTQDDASSSVGIAIAVLDNGCGMNEATLQHALQFGGTKRFNDRFGQGRFGMGLPNSSLSQARRVDVYTWSNSRRPIHSYLDVDEIVRGDLRSVPHPLPRDVPPTLLSARSRSGTVVVWSRCDRLSNQKEATIATKISTHIGRMFRYFLWGGLQIRVNGSPVEAVDPLFLRGGPTCDRAVMPWTPRVYEIDGRAHSTSPTIRVRFSELPVAAWSGLSSSEKRTFGIAGGGGVSIIRAGREIAYGWFFMGGKRRENYDDWWRCEIAFDPAVDELFGVTHSKQGINPSSDVLAFVTPDVERAAHLLNGRVRDAFRLVDRATNSATSMATRRDHLLPTMAVSGDEASNRTRRHRQTRGQFEYELVVERSADAFFYTSRLEGYKVIIQINQNHPFYDKIYLPACNSPNSNERYRLESLIVSLARADVEARAFEVNSPFRRHKQDWSNALAAFLEG